jgi:type II secretory pathway component GspD/PulD (secretin)
MVLVSACAWPARTAAAPTTEQAASTNLLVAQATPEEIRRHLESFPFAERRGAPRRGGEAIPAGRFSLDFVDADVIDVLKSMAAQSGANIAVSSEVSGKVTLSLSNVTLEEALRIVTLAAGVDYAIVDRAYIVGTPENIRAMRVADLKSRAVVLQYLKPKEAQTLLGRLTPEITVSIQEGTPIVLLLGPEKALDKAEAALHELDMPPPPMPPVTEVIHFTYVTADQVKEYLTTLASALIVQPGPTPNSLVVTGDPTLLATAKGFVQAVDVKPAPGEGETKFYLIKYVDPDEAQARLSTMLPDLQVTAMPRSKTPIIQLRAQGGAGGTAALIGTPAVSGTGGASGGAGAVGTGQAQAETGPITMLALSGAAPQVARGLELLRQMDVAPGQVAIRAMITQVRQSEVEKLGIEWSGLGTAGTSLTLTEAGDPETGRPIHLGRFTRNPLAIASTIRALSKRDRAKILSEPRTVVLDGRQATFHSGQTIFFETTIATGITGTPIFDIRQVDVGVTMVVTPRINPTDDGGEITLTVAPTVSSASPSAFSSIPLIDERSTITTVRVKNGETIVIAGLMEDQQSVTVTKVPFLSDIPLLGPLFFRHVDREPIHNELLIFITPEILK